MAEELTVIKRGGATEPFSSEKIKQRLFILAGLSFSLSEETEEDWQRPIPDLDLDLVVSKVINSLPENPTTIQIDEISTDVCATLINTHPNYSRLASRIAISNMQKETPPSFSMAMEALYGNINHKTLRHEPLISLKTMKIVRAFAEFFNQSVNHERDYSYDIFGFKTLQKGYLIKNGRGKTIERPQYMLMRVAIQVKMDLFIDENDNLTNPDDIDEESFLETYNTLSEGYYTHATPTLFNAGTNKPQMSSCFLVKIKEDSIEGIYDSLKDCAKISQNSGGIGIVVSHIRAKGSYIAGTGGTSNGLVPMLKNYESTAIYVDQGGNKRKGSFAIYNEPWHADILEFLELRNQAGKEELRARALFTGLWVPDLFMKRVANHGKWSFFCPNEAPGLPDVWGEKFEELYEKYEASGLARKTVDAITVWDAILDAQIETGTPYMLYKDACNRKSNQQNLGTTSGSNLCIEVIEYTAPDEIAVCNLASLALPKFVKRMPKGGDVLRHTHHHRFDGFENYFPESFPCSRGCANYDYYFDFTHFRKVVRIATRNLNKVIDFNHYPIKEAENSNMKHRPIGLGVTGLADVFSLLKIPFDGREAAILNRRIFENLYFAALEASCQLAAEMRKTYSSYQGSPLQRGFLHPDLCDPDQAKACEKGLTRQQYLNMHPERPNPDPFGMTRAGSAKALEEICSRYPDKSMLSCQEQDIWVRGCCQWNGLREAIADFGVYNSLLVAPMPTATTAQIMGHTECFEPPNTMLGQRRVLAGEFVVINKHLVKEIGWDRNLANQIIANKGSIQTLAQIPPEIRRRFKTVFEIPQRTLVDMAHDRGIFIDQNQSLNIFMKDPTRDKLTKLHFHAWRKGMKTSMYYLRTKPAIDALKYSLDPKATAKTEEEKQSKPVAEDPCASGMCSG